MSADEEKKPVGLSKEQYDVITNKIAVAMAKHEAVVAGWIAKSARANEPRRTQEELEAEDRALFQPQPPRLGLGCPIPARFLKDNAESSNKELRARLFSSKGLKAAKVRDADEKAASTKRGLRDQSSDEEEGRSALGRAKKQRTKAAVEARESSAKVPSSTTHAGTSQFATDVAHDLEEIGLRRDTIVKENLLKFPASKDSPEIEPGGSYNEDKMDIDTQPKEVIPPLKLRKKQRKRKNQAANSALAERSGVLVSRPKHASPSPTPIQDQGTANKQDEADMEGVIDGTGTLEGYDSKKESKKEKKRQKQLDQQATVELGREETPIGVKPIDPSHVDQQDEQASLEARIAKGELKRQKKRDKKAKKKLERAAASQT
ncbi:hypothetical protein BJ875DRAFT_451589 [Amylocarpus encephaloides]|uniref:Uncharacterized protein n=1 Tax=Amylocarpus encephaloides TaxID=45428 RepID=A0A9P7YQW0_9HELO|nr:hypothetical protein BJ875DRAFT_451589 [Amylocarpus encephaloides]